MTDYRNHGIERMITDLIVSSRYLPGVLWGTSCFARLRLVGWTAPRSVAHVVCCGYPGSYPPKLVPERLVSAVQRHLELVRAGVNKVEQ